MKFMLCFEIKSQAAHLKCGGRGWQAESVFDSPPIMHIVKLGGSWACNPG